MPREGAEFNPQAAEYEQVASDASLAECHAHPIRGVVEHYRAESGEAHEGPDAEGALKPRLVQSLSEVLNHVVRILPATAPGSGSLADHPAAWRCLATDLEGMGPRSRLADVVTGHVAGGGVTEEWPADGTTRVLEVAGSKPPAISPANAAPRLPSLAPGFDPASLAESYLELHEQQDDSEWELLRS